jgi:hypothetical protein
MVTSWSKQHRAERMFDTCFKKPHITQYLGLLLNWIYHTLVLLLPRCAFDGWFRGLWRKGGSCGSKPFSTCPSLFQDIDQRIEERKVTLPQITHTGTYTTITTTRSDLSTEKAKCWSELHILNFWRQRKMTYNFFTMRNEIFFKKKLI